jgi:hypothetical protein
MAKKQESNWNLETLTDAEVYAAIRYLEPDPRSANGQDNVICVAILILLLGCLGFLWLWHRG